MHNSAAMNQYKQVGTQSSVAGADPHTLIQMLINGAIERLNTAKMHIQEKNVARKGEDIGRAISIIDGLRSSLDMKKGGEIAQNLESLYEYMQHQLLSANIENDLQKVDEVLGLLNEIRSGWNSIPQDIRKPKQPAK